MVGILLALFACRGFAATPLLYAGDANVAVHHVAADAGVPVWELDPLRVTELFKDDTPRIVGSTSSPRCESPATNLELREALARIEARVGYQQLTEAKRELAAAKTSLACLSEPAEASLGARLFFLDAYTAQITGSGEAAKASFERALQFSPTLKWDSAFPPTERALFDAAVRDRSKIETADLFVASDAEDMSLSIDGRVTRVSDHVELAEGKHLIQVLDPTVRTFDISLSKDTPAALVFPATLEDAVVSDVEKPEARALVSALLDHANKNASVAYVWTGEETWRVSDTWERLDGVPTSWKTPRELWLDRLFSGGTVAIATGAVTFGVGSGLYFANKQPPPSGIETQTAFENRKIWGGAGLGLMYSGLATVTFGAGGVGFAIIWRAP